MRPRPFLLLLAGVVLALMAAGEAEARVPEWSYATGGTVYSVAISADGEYIAVGSEDHKVYLFDKDISTPLWSYQTGSIVYSVAISADGEYVTAGSWDNRLHLFDKDSSTPLWSYTAGDLVYSVAISTDGEYIAAGSDDSNVYLFDKDSSTPLWNYATGDSVYSVAVSADGEYIAAGSADNKVYLFHKDGSTPLWSHTTGNDVHSVSISADGEYIVASSRGNKVYLFGKDSSTPLWSYETGDEVWSVSISADGEYIAAGSRDDNVYLFSKDSSTPLWSYTTGDWVRSVTISADGEYIAAGSRDGNVYLFDKDSSTPLWSSDAGGYDVRSVSISADGEYIAAGYNDEKVYHFENNYPPTAPIDSISPSPARFDEEVTFSGSGADSDGTIMAYEWESDIDGFLSDEEDFSATGFTVGTHTVSFRVQDNDGEWSEWNTAALVVNPNAPPVATIESITPLPARFDAEVTFSGSSSDSDGTVVAYEWNSDIDGFLNDEEDFSITGFTVGNRTISFRVQDNDGEWSEWNTAALVVNPNAPPVATIDFITPSPAQFHAEVTFNGSGADSDGTVVAYEWNSSIDGFLSDEEDFSTTGFSSGYHSISFRVQDNDGDWSWNSMTLFVKPDPPPVAYAESAEFQITEDGYQIVLEGYGEDGNELVEYEWRAKNVESQEFAFTNSYNFSSPGTRADRVLENPFTIDRYFVFSLRVKDEYGVWSDWAAVPDRVYTDDGDGYDHLIDDFPLDPTQWSDWDADGFGDNPSGNNPDAFPYNSGEWLDTDSDGIGDNSDALVSIPNNYVYFSAAVVVPFLSAVVMEIRARNSLATTRNKLNKLIEEGIDNPEVLASIDGLDKLSGMALMSSPRRDASSLLAETLARQDKLLEALEKVEILQNETSEMKREDIPVDDFLKNISKLEKQLLKEAKDDFGEEYLENINKILLDRMSEEAKK